MRRLEYKKVIRNIPSKNFLSINITTPLSLVSATVGSHVSSSPCVPKALDALADMHQPGETEDYFCV